MAGNIVLDRGWLQASSGRYFNCSADDHFVDDDQRRIYVRIFGTMSSGGAASSYHLARHMDHPARPGTYDAAH